MKTEHYDSQASFASMPDESPAAAAKAPPGVESGAGPNSRQRKRPEENLAAALAATDAPCDDCYLADQCAEGLACSVYKVYVTTGKFDNETIRKPDAETYRMMFPNG
jgi:hypothetical protein